MHRLFNVLNSEQRIKIVEFLLNKENYTCICEMDKVVDRDRSVIYRHFKKLEAAGLLETRRRGKRVECKLKNHKKISKLLQIAEEVTRSES